MPLSAAPSRSYSHSRPLTERHFSNQRICISSALFAMTAALDKKETDNVKIPKTQIL
jgi:hypothetical protein